SVVRRAPWDRTRPRLHRQGVQRRGRRPDRLGALRCGHEVLRSEPAAEPAHGQLPRPRPGRDARPAPRGRRQRRRPRRGARVRPLRLGEGSRRQPIRAVGAAVSEPEQPPAGEADEELLKQVEDELKKLKVSDLLVQMLYTVSSLGYRKLSAEDRDLDQAKLAIESLRALLPVLEGAVPEDGLRDFRQVTSNLQLAYAEAAKA